jgi:hypothetical protein
MFLREGFVGELRRPVRAAAHPKSRLDCRCTFKGSQEDFIVRSTMCLPQLQFCPNINI